MGTEEVETNSIQTLAEESDKLDGDSLAEVWARDDVTAWETNSRVRVPRSCSRPVSPQEKVFTIRRRQLSAMRKRGSTLPKEPPVRRGSVQRRTERDSVFPPPVPLRPAQIRQSDSQKRIHHHSAERLLPPKQEPLKLYKPNVLTEEPAPMYIKLGSSSCEHSLLQLQKMRNYLGASHESVHSAIQSPQGSSTHLQARRRLYS